MLFLSNNNYSSLNQCNIIITIKKIQINLNLLYLFQILQTLFFLVCLVNDIFGSNVVGLKNRPFIRKCKDYFHAAIGFPVAMVRLKFFFF